MIKEIVVPKTPKGSQGTFSYFKPIISNKKTGIVAINKNKNISLLVHFSIPFMG
jgi:hypothetical protein